MDTAVVTRWLILNTTLWGLGFAAGLVAGFVVPVIGDVVAVIIVGLLLIAYQTFEIRNLVPGIKHWAITTMFGLLVGIGVGFAFTFFTLRSIGLGPAHIYALPITVVIISFAQWYQLRKITSSAWVWIILHIVGLAVTLQILDFMDPELIDFRLDLLVVRDRDFSAVLPWGLLGAIAGLLYGLQTLFAFGRMKIE